MALARSDWTREALAAFAEEGLAAVAVEPLARRLKATKGSFYWHFSGREELIAATLERWRAEETEAVIADVLTIPEPYDRLVALARFAFGEAAAGSADAAIYAVAADPRVAATVATVTRRRIGFIARLFRDLGLPRTRAARHAQLTYSTFLGMGQLRRAQPDQAPGPRELRTVVDLALNGALLAAGLPVRPDTGPAATPRSAQAAKSSRSA